MSFLSKSWLGIDMCVSIIPRDGNIFLLKMLDVLYEVGHYVSKHVETIDLDVLTSYPNVLF